MSIIGDLRKISGNPTLDWKQGVCPYVSFELNGELCTVLKRRHGYQMNVTGKGRTPEWVTVAWPQLKERLLRKKGGLQ